MLHYDPQHVSNSTLLILRRTNCITTDSGIVTMETLISTILYIYPCYVNSDDFMFLLFNDLSRKHLTTLDITEFKRLPAGSRLNYRNAEADLRRDVHRCHVHELPSNFLNWSFLNKIPIRLTISIMGYIVTVTFKAVRSAHFYIKAHRHYTN
jgi:hypothetical protein